MNSQGAQTALNLSELEEYYRTWWAYLLYCEPFREYIRVSLHERKPLSELSRLAKEASHYHEPWVLPLLPELFERYPSMADFPRVWHRFTVLSRIWHQSIETETEHFEAKLSNILSRVQKGEISTTEARELICNQQMIHIPLRQSKAETLHGIEQILSDPEPRLDGTLRSIQFHLPAYMGHNTIRKGDLETLQKNLTWHVLTLGLHTQDEWADLYDGTHVRYFDPDGQTWDYKPLFKGTPLLTGTPQERAIAARWKKSSPMERFFTRPSPQPKHTLAARARKKDIASFRKWSRTCASDARETLQYVSNGWFPRHPQKK